MIQPTVGRVVYYWPCEDDVHVMACEVGSELRADVVKVNDDGTVNLKITDWAGVDRPRANVRLVQPEEEQLTDLYKGVGYRAWMPFQVGQAKNYSYDTLNERLNQALLQIEQLDGRVAKLEAVSAKYEAEWVGMLPASEVQVPTAEQPPAQVAPPSPEEAVEEAPQAELGPEHV